METAQGGGARLDEGTVREALGRALELLVPLGPRLEFLLRERSLDDVAEVTQRHAALDRPWSSWSSGGRVTARCGPTWRPGGRSPCW